MKKPSERIREIALELQHKWIKIHVGVVPPPFESFGASAIVKYLDEQHEPRPFKPDTTEYKS